jgi:hypothetical protein
VECGVIRKRHDSGFDKVWFSGLVLVIILVIGGVEVNPGPQTDQAKIDQILAYVKNQKKDSKLIKQMVEAYKQEMTEMRRGMDSLGPKFDQLSEVVTGMIKDYGELKEVFRECEASCRQLENKLRNGDDERRKNNIIIFGLEEQGEEKYFGTLDTVVKCLNETMKVDVNRENNENIDYVTRIGRKKGVRPILVKFISFSKKLQILKNKRNLAGSKIRVEEDLSIEDRKIRQELIPYLKDAKRKGHKAFLRKGSLIVDGRAYGLSYLKGNIQLGAGNVDIQMDNPAGSQKDMTQHQTGNGATQEFDIPQREGAGGESPPRTRSRNMRLSQSARVRRSSAQQQPQGIEEVKVGRTQQYNLRGWVTGSNLSASKVKTGNGPRSDTSDPWSTNGEGRA